MSSWPVIRPSREEAACAHATPAINELRPNRRSAFCPKYNSPTATVLPASAIHCTANPACFTYPPESVGVFQSIFKSDACGANIQGNFRFRWKSMYEGSPVGHFETRYAGMSLLRNTSASNTTEVSTVIIRLQASMRGSQSNSVYPLICRM